MPDATTIISGAVIAVISAASVRIMRSMALRHALLDVPNERSSHKVSVPRLGGAAFIPVVLLCVIGTWSASMLPLPIRATFLSGASVLFAVSLIDDFVSLSTTVRFAAQFAAAMGAVYSALAARPLLFGNFGVMAVVLTMTVVVVGLINIFNFMDGIDGIAGVQGVVTGLAWWKFAGDFGAPTAASLGLALSAGTLGFLTLNWPPAKIFMGDAGSTVLGYSFAVLPLLVWAEAKPPCGFGSLIALGLLLVWPFWADGTFTILRRLRKRENILKAHRSHLYQRLVIAGKFHRTVTLAYGGLATIGAILGWPIIRGYAWAIPLSGFVVLGLFGCLWRWTVASERRASASPSDFRGPP